MSSDDHFEDANGNGESDPLRYAKSARLYLKSLGHKTNEPKVKWWDGSYWWFEGQKWRRYSDKEAYYKVMGHLISQDVTSSSRTCEFVLKALGGMVSNFRDMGPPCWDPIGGPKMESEYWLAMKNGMVDPERLALGDKGGLRTTTSRWFGLSYLPYTYDASADCPKWKEYLEAQVEDETARLLLQEFFGYWLTPDTSQQACLFLIGRPGSGKTQTMETAKLLLGEENCALFAVEDMNKNFALSAMEGKLLNIADEIRDIKRSERVLKWWISGQSVTIDRKFLTHKTIAPTARIVAGMNQWPCVADVSDGMWRRIHVIPMDVVVAPAKKVSNYARKMFSRERAGILNWALEGLRRLREQDGFTACESGQKLLLQEKERAQSHLAFITDHIVEDPSGFVSSRDMICEYERYCTANAVGASANLSDITSEILFRFGGRPSTCRGRVDGQQLRGLKGIRWVSDAEEHRQKTQPQDVTE
jgi:putative DNA primase/helicase